MHDIMLVARMICWSTGFARRTLGHMPRDPTDVPMYGFISHRAATWIVSMQSWWDAQPSAKERMIRHALLRLQYLIYGPSIILVCVFLFP